MVTEARYAVNKYIKASLHYMENALLMLRNKDAGKASELLWGSMAEALQAVAASRGKHLANHRSLHWFVAQLGKELEDKDLVAAFYQAEALHSNFHEVELTIEDVAINLEPIRTTVLKLLKLIPSELLDEPTIIT